MKKNYYELIEMIKNDVTGSIFYGCKCVEIKEKCHIKIGLAN